MPDTDVVVPRDAGARWWSTGVSPEPDLPERVASLLAAEDRGTQVLAHTRVPGAPDAHRWWGCPRGQGHAVAVRTVVDVRPEPCAGPGRWWRLSVLACPSSGARWDVLRHGAPYRDYGLAGLKVVDAVAGLGYTGITVFEGDEGQELVRRLASDRAAAVLLLALKPGSRAELCSGGFFPEIASRLQGVVSVVAVHGGALHRLNRALPSTARLVVGSARGLYHDGQGLRAGATIRIPSDPRADLSWTVALGEAILLLQRKRLDAFDETGHAHAPDLLEEMTAVLHHPFPVDTPQGMRSPDRDELRAWAGTGTRWRQDLFGGLPAAPTPEKSERRGHGVLDNLVADRARGRDEPGDEDGAAPQEGREHGHGWLADLTDRLERQRAETAQVRAQRDNLARRRELLVRALADARARQAGRPSPDVAAWREERLLLRGRAERAEAERDAAHTDVDALGAELDAALRRIEYLTARAHERGDTAVSSGPGLGPELEPVFTTWRDLLREGRERLGERVWLSPLLEESTATLAARPPWLRRAWSVLVALYDYAGLRAAADGQAPANLHAYLERPERWPGRRYPRTIHAPTESRTVLDNPAWRAERLFPVPDEDDTQKMVLMLEHVRIGDREGHPRLHLHDDTAPTRTGTIYVGYLGKHLTNSRT
ncbi:MULTISPECIES: hypothetical protein [Actinosynnema]|uniref:hypothetical protein n=1 Tax=Actinosynnema TaxID=40566 RepID=UPI0020A5C691|nr:hypothetical protein [Actinosynnema pretiosum]MCP2097288.1 hypothetical protein [Actinosynnema pretiosum]